MIQRAHDSTGTPLPLLAIRDPEVGPRLREIRIFTPRECARLKVVEELKKKIGGELGRLDPAMAARLEKAMDDGDALDELTKQWLSEEERLQRGYWPGYDPSYLEIEEGTTLARWVIQNFRSDLRGFVIRVLFQKELPPANRRARIGTAMKLPGKMHHLSGIHAVITLGYQAWRELSNADRQRLVHHELEHLVVTDNGLGARGHDFEDFATIVEMYGIRSESERMNMDGSVGDAIERAAAGQFDLIDELGEVEEMDEPEVEERRPVLTAD